MCPVDFILEVKDVDEIVVIGANLLLWDTLGENLGILTEIQDWMIPRRFPIDPVRTCFINTYPSSI
jgi:hypothetical protein